LDSGEGLRGSSNYYQWGGVLGEKGAQNAMPKLAQVARNPLNRRASGLGRYKNKVVEIVERIE
jgi:hypothetical protein